MVAIFRKNQRLMGIDIGSESIKFMELQMTNLGCQVTNFSKVAIPRDKVNGQAIEDYLSLTNTIRMAVLGLGTVKPKVATAIKEQHVFVDYLTLPHMSVKELAEAINYEIANYLPFPREETQVDFGKIREIEEDGIAKQEVMIVAAPQNIVQEKCEMLRTAGVVPMVMDIEALALQRMVKEVAKINGDNETFAIINMGFSTTSISVFNEEMLKFTQTLPFGGHKLTQALCEFFKISYEDAEKTKKLIDLTGEFQDHGVNILLHQKADVLVPVLESMFQEIKACLKSFQVSGEINLDSCYLVGGCALLQGLDEIMAQELNMKVQVINPASFLGLAPHLESREKEIYEAGPTFAVAIGLALSEV